MNETLASLRQWLADVYGDESTEALEFYDTILNDGIRAFTLGHNCDALRVQKIVSVVDGVLTLPPLTQRINYLCESVTSGLQVNVFTRKSEPNVSGNTRTTSNHYTPNGLKRTDGTIYVGDITKGSSTIIRDKRVSGNDWYTSADIGSLLILEGKKGIYEVTAVDTTTDAETITVYPKVSYASESSVNIEVDPAGEKQYLAYDNAGALYTGDITISVQEHHPMLVNANDRLVIDGAESVKIYAMTVAYRQGKYDVVSDRLKNDLDLAYRLETANEASEPDVIFPVGITGGKSLFEI